MRPLGARHASKAGSNPNWDFDYAVGKITDRPLDARSKLLEGIGECLHAWGCVEIELSNLYMILQGVKRDDFSHKTRAAFEIVISLEVRLAMIRAYVGSDPKLVTYVPHFDRLHNRITALNKKRHEIAHFVVVARNRKNGMQYLVRPFFTWNAFNEQTGTELNAEQIADRARRFGFLAEQIMRHVQHVGALLELPPEHYAKAGEIAFPALDADDLIPGGQKPPPKSSPR